MLHVTSSLKIHPEGRIFLYSTVHANQGLIYFKPSLESNDMINPIKDKEYALQIWKHTHQKSWNGILNLIAILHYVELNIFNISISFLIEQVPYRPED